MLKQPLLTVSLLSLLAGCGQLQTRDTDSPFFRLPVGTVLELHQQLEVPAQRTRIFLQRGEVVGKQGIDLFQPSCNLEIRDLQPDTQLIEPDRFTVVQTRQGRESVVAWDGLKLAALGWSFSSGGGGPPMVHRYYHYDLQSERQPQVMRLTCRGGLADLWESKPPTLVETKEALGDVATILLEP